MPAVTSSNFHTDRGKYTVGASSRVGRKATDCPVRRGGTSAALHQPDHITLLTSTDEDISKVVCKTWYVADAGVPVCDQFGNKPHWFSVSQVEVSDFSTLEEALTRLVDCPHTMAIRGEPLPGVDWTRTNRLYRKQADGREPTFEDKPRRWLALDFDTFVPQDFDPTDGVAGAQYYQSTLPEAFHDVSCWWMLSASAGIKPEARIRLAFWLDRALDCRQLGLLFARTETDHGVFNPVQGQGIAAPIFRGMKDPINERCGVLEGQTDTVQVPDVPEPTERDHNAAKREFQELKVKYGADWPTAKLTEIANQIQATPQAGVNPWGGGGRHNALFCGGLSVSGLIDKGYLPFDLSKRVLTAAGKNAGISDAEVERTITNAFRQGGVQ